MPLVRVDVTDAWSESDLKDLLDEIHEAVVQALSVPVRDRYQILQIHSARWMILEDTGLGFTRTKQTVLISVTTRLRSTEAKEAFYQLVAERLGGRFGLAGTDLLITMVENGDADWSFAHGQAQFLTGAL